MNVLFIGNHPTVDLIENTNGRLDSFYRTSETIIEGFRSRNNISIRVITSPDIPSFPKEKLFFKKHYSIKDETLMVSSLNIPIIKHLWTAIRMFLEARKIIKKNNGETFVLIPYMVFRHVIALRLISHFCKDVKVGLIIPDVFFYKNIISRWLNAITEKMAVKSDLFILYTEAMSEYLKIQNKPHITIEGFKKISPLHVPAEDYKSIVYAGTLDLKYGIERLVRMMDYLPERDIQLHIYGGGDGLAIVKEAAARDARIQCHGVVSKAEADSAIQKAIALINPRNENDGDFVRFSFPSKDIDYLASGIPSVLCKLPGMPKDYYGYFVDAGSGQPEELAKAVKLIYNMTLTERNAFSKKAYEFIVKRMDINNQIDRIINLFQVAI